MQQRRNAKTRVAEVPRENPRRSDGSVCRISQVRKSDVIPQENRTRIPFYSVSTESLHALHVGATRRQACVLVSPVSLPRFLTLDAGVHPTLNSRLEGPARKLVRLLDSHLGEPGLTGGRVAPRIFARGNRPGRCCRSAGFLGDIPFPPALASPALNTSIIGPSGVVDLTAAETIIFLLQWRRKLRVNSALFVPQTRGYRKHPMKVIELGMEQRRNERAWGTGDRRPSASSGTIPTCENPGVTRPGIEPGSPWWEASGLTAGARMSGNVSLYQNTAIPVGRVGRQPSGNRAVYRLFTTDRLPPRRTWLKPWPDHSRIFASGNRARRYRMSAAFLGDLPFSPPLHSCAASFSPLFTLIGSRDLASREPMRVIEVRMWQRCNEWAGGTGDPRENPLTSGVVRYDSRMRKIRE
ncbi:hypothetical protein PR048_007847 [Dryococelus australis]|uniref:Uncharacterized protein n=1 Tax=Dryococelus australis TaxID=614101 RepID=A0ABQ9HVE4_9NEOP|nr:hypothetical protein PR048_007847 [Dryococelus australis]